MRDGSARMCISSDFQRYLPHVTSCVSEGRLRTARGLIFFVFDRERSSLLYRQKCEAWCRFICCRSYVPPSNRLPGDRTVRGQMAVTQFLWDCLHTNPANELGTRSFLVYWFMGHVTR